MIKKLKIAADNDFVFYTLFIIIACLLFVNGLESFISSSEFWSIYLSQKIFTAGQQWSSVYLKPLFHLLLSTIYLIQLNDFYHIITAKILFSFNGVLQFFLIFKLLNMSLSKRFLNLFLTCFIFSSPYFLSHMNQVRSDQLALTVFLLIMNWANSQNKRQKWAQVILFVALPLIAYKHIYFAILCLWILPLKSYVQIWKQQQPVRKFIGVLLLINMAVWGICLAVPALHYFLESAHSSLSDFNLLLPWAKTEWYYIYFSFFPFLFKDFRTFIRQKALSYLLPVQLTIIGILLAHPQKLPFFIASFLPILYLASVLFCQFLEVKKLVAFRLVFLVLFVSGIYSLYRSAKYYHVFTLNNPQLITIDRISNIVTANNMTYLDGMGILPRARNIGCFVSPDDQVANQFCLQSLEQKKPDAIIVTNRLMGLPFDFVRLAEMGYSVIGPNLFIKNNLIDKTKINSTDWEPPTVLFSYDQLY